VPVACPYGRRPAESHGDSRSLDPRMPRSAFPQLRSHDVERLPKLIVGDPQLSGWTNLARLGACLQ
jgi:hypothetical protein